MPAGEECHLYQGDFLRDAVDGRLGVVAALD